MDRDDHDRTPARRGRPRKDAGQDDGLEGVRREIAIEVALELIEEFTGRRLSTRELVEELLARLREE